MGMQETAWLLFWYKLRSPCQTPGEGVYSLGVFLVRQMEIDLGGGDIVVAQIVTDEVDPHVALGEMGSKLGLTHLRQLNPDFGPSCA